MAIVYQNKLMFFHFKLLGMLDNNYRYIIRPRLMRYITVGMGDIENFVYDYYEARIFQSSQLLPLPYFY